MIYIQTADGLSQVSPSLTKEKIITALGYTPADNATFYEDDSGTLIVADEKGYVIARIGSDGLTTTQISADAIKLNDVDLATKLAELETNSSTTDLSNYYTKTEIDEAISNINTGESNFSGDYTDLNNAPTIVNDNEDELIICDSNGNIIVRVNANGLNTTNLYLNNTLINLSNPLKDKKLSILGASISSYSGYCPEGYNVHYPSGDVTSVDQTWWKKLIDNNGMILGYNSSYSGSSVQTDGTGVAYIDDERIAHLGSNGDPDIIIIQAGINDAKLEDFATLGEINKVIDLPLTADSAIAYDTTTFLGAYQALIEKLMVTYPNAQIACWSLTWTSRPDVITSDDLLVASNRIKELCDLYGLIFLDIRKCGITPANMATYLGAGDTTITHPNAAGMELIAKYIEKCLK